MFNFLQNFLQQQQNRMFMLNILYKVRDMSRSASASNRRAIEERVSTSLQQAEQQHRNRPKTAKGERCSNVTSNWRNDFDNIYSEFAIVNSPSYRASSATLLRQHQQQQRNASYDVTASNSLNQSEFTTSTKGSLATLPEGAVVATKQTKSSMSTSQSNESSRSTHKASIGSLSRADQKLLSKKRSH